MKRKIYTIIGALLVAVLLGVIMHSNFATANYPYLRSGQATTTSGTQVQVISALGIPDDIGILVKAKNANTGIVTLGYSPATANYTGINHFSLYPGESVSLKVSNANLIYFDVEITGEGIEYITEWTP